MNSDRGDSRAFYQLFADLASGTLERVTDPVSCAEYVASQVRELLGVKAVAVVACHGSHSPHFLLAVRPLRHEQLLHAPAIDELIHASHASHLAMYVNPGDQTPSGAALRSLGLSDSVIVPLRVGSEMIGALVLLGLMDVSGIDTIVHSLDRLSSLLALIMRQADQYRDLELAVRERTAELQATRDRLEEQHAFLSSLLSSLPNPVFVQDATGGILRCNPAFSLLVGKTERELVEGQAWTEGDFSKECVLGDGLGQDEFDFPMPGGCARRMLASRAPFHSRQGELSGFINVLTDVSDLDEARQAAETSSRAKSEFLANMSHEIRTPLNGIVGMMQLLSRSYLDAEQKEYVYTAIRSSQRLTQLLTDILEISRIEAGKMNVAAEEFHFADLRDSVRDLFAIQAKAKGLELSFDIDESIPSFVVGDEGRLRQILFNLVGNATKFTSRGGVRISARRIDVGETMKVEFAVADTGIGIPRERQEDIFKAFTQVDGSAVRQHGGVGLGLAIVKRLVDMMGGSIDVQSEVEKGTIMTVTVPLLPGKTLRASAQEAALPEIRGKRVLVVEDDPINQLALTRMLKKLGHVSTLARNGREALDTLETHDFDCVLMDIQMPVMDGIEATRRIRAATLKRVSPDIPVVALTGHAMPGDREHFLEQGMTAYLSKPVDMDCLARLISQLTA
jgi:signal transduction histidine kinase/CheY-like chemotaxis protein